MLSIFESFDPLKDFYGSTYWEEEKPNFGGRFSPPSEALMNVLSTPSLNFSETHESSDYLWNQQNAKNGFAPEESEHTQKFKLNDE